MTAYILTNEERELLEHFETQGTATEARRARIILMSATDTTTSEIAEAVDLSTGQVRYWRREWKKDRTGIFGDQTASDEEPAPEAVETAETGAETVIEIEAEAEIETETASSEAPQPGIDVPRLPLELAETAGIQVDDPMAEAARKVLLFHFERMLLHEPGSRLGEDIEAVHDMRVATRRMRSAFRLFKPFFNYTTIEPFVRDLRQTGRVLGDVRDLDVFMEKAQHFLADHPDTDLTPLFEAWEKRLYKARQKLVRHLDSKSFARFVKRFNRFLNTPGMGAVPVPEDRVTAFQVRHLAPRMIYTRYEQVRAYETVLDNGDITTLHALRIDFKRLRYTLEFFEHVLGPGASAVIKEIKGMQDHLGDLNDAEVAGIVLQEFVDDYNCEYSGIPLFMRPNINGVLDYAAARAAEKETLLESFPAAWQRFNRENVRRDLALAVSVL